MIAGSFSPVVLSNHLFWNLALNMDGNWTSTIFPLCRWNLGQT
uniref:Uncharacterized protein n=1 Tax=Lutzomyia longipalpis TaxID=7200 RepID=A0A1B0CFD2_LUTLO